MFKCGPQFLPYTDQILYCLILHLRWNLQLGPGGVWWIWLNTADMFESRSNRTDLIFFSLFSAVHVHISVVLLETCFLLSLMLCLWLSTQKVRRQMAPPTCRRGLSEVSAFLQWLVPLPRHIVLALLWDWLPLSTGYSCSGLMLKYK